MSYRSGLPVPGHLLLHRAYNPSASHPLSTSPYTGEARGGRSVHPASQLARPISPSVKPFGLATSLVRGRQDGGRKQKSSDLSVRALAGAEGFGTPRSASLRGPRCILPPRSPHKATPCGMTAARAAGGFESFRETKKL